MPYPGESLYSILCRYHVRSGNTAAAQTIRQLFGGYVSLCSTLLLPSSMLDCFDTWIPADAGIDSSILIWKHTAYSLCALRDFSEYEYARTGKFRSEEKSLNRSRLGSRQHLIQHPSGRLRFCPLCAAEQKKIYGEAYWQILPQLDGVEYCPFHQTRIISTSVSNRKMPYSFLPADCIIRDKSKHDHSLDYPCIEGIPLIILSPLFVAMAKVILYLWEHLPNQSGIWTLLSRYRNILSKEDAYWQSSEHVRSILLKNNPVCLVNWLLNTMQNVEPRYIYFNSFSLFQHAMLISMLTPSPETFFTSNPL